MCVGAGFWDWGWGSCTGAEGRLVVETEPVPFSSSLDFPRGSDGWPRFSIGKEEGRCSSKRCVVCRVWGAGVGSSTPPLSRRRHRGPGAGGAASRPPRPAAHPRTAARCLRLFLLRADWRATSPIDPDSSTKALGLNNLVFPVRASGLCLYARARAKTSRTRSLRSRSNPAQSIMFLLRGGTAGRAAGDAGRSGTGTGSG